jgi:hypothetical protein
VTLGLITTAGALLVAWGSRDMLALSVMDFWVGRALLLVLGRCPARLGTVGPGGSRPRGRRMTAAGWCLMLGSLGAVVSFTVFCFCRVLRRPARPETP